MKKILIPIFILLLASCSTYTIADGRANISIPEKVVTPSTKLDPSSNVQGVSTNAIFLNVGSDKINLEDISEEIEMLKELDPDIIVLIGSQENQVAIRRHFKNVFELSGTSIILSDRPYNTEMIDLYIGKFPAILAETEFPILDSIY